MRLRVASVGQSLPGWANAAWQDFARRMPRELPLELVEVPVSKRSRNADLQRLRTAEAEALLSAVSPGYHVVALDGRGSPWSTSQLAGRLGDWMQQGRPCGFLIGGPDGLDDRCLEMAAERWSLGALTLPHALARVVVAEQLYRAWTIYRNHPYHRE